MASSIHYSDNADQALSWAQQYEDGPLSATSTVPPRLIRLTIPAMTAASI